MYHHNRETEKWPGTKKQLSVLRFLLCYSSKISIRNSTQDIDEGSSFDWWKAWANLDYCNGSDVIVAYLNITAYPQANSMKLSVSFIIYLSIYLSIHIFIYLFIYKEDRS